MSAPARLAHAHSLAAALAGEVRAPLAIDLCCGLGGWTDELLAEGWQVVGIDIEEHVYGEHRYPAGLIIQDVLTVDGRAFSNADLIVASPPCQFFSYCAMPWSRAKALAAKVRADPALLENELALFNACFRIQREACEAAGRHIPLIVENVRGAIPWVGRSRWNFGSYHLWGDVPALMPRAFKGVKAPGMDWNDRTRERLSFTDIAGRHAAAEQGCKVPGFRFDGSGRSFQSASVGEARRDPMWARGFTATAADRLADGVKCGGDWFGPDNNSSAMRNHSSKSPARKAASAMIAKIPFALSSWIARCFLPRAEEAA